MDERSWSPKEVNSIASSYTATQACVENWLEELVCDLFGLVTFGPAFLAAHQVILRSSHRTPYGIETSHPPYAVRHKMLIKAMRILGWNEAIFSKDDQLFQSETEALKYIMDDPYVPWADVFEDQQISGAIIGIEEALTKYSIGPYRSPGRDSLEVLLDRLQRRLPPLLETVNGAGKVVIPELDVRHIFYAGWVYCLSKSLAVTIDRLDFLQTNKLCDLALLQAQGMELFRRRRTDGNTGPK